MQPRVTARAAAAAAARPVNIRPAGDMWAPEGGYAVRQLALVLACQAGTQIGWPLQWRNAQHSIYMGAEAPHEPSIGSHPRDRLAMSSMGRAWDHLCAT